MPIHAAEQELLKPKIIGPHRIRESDHRTIQPADIVDAANLRRGQASTRLIKHIGHHLIDHPTDRFTDQPGRLQSRMIARHGGEDRPGQRHLMQVLDGEETGAQAVIDIVVVIGDVVTERRHLRFGTGKALQIEIAQGIVIGNGRRHFLRQRLGRRMRTEQRAVMLDDAFERFPA